MLAAPSRLEKDGKVDRGLSVLDDAKTARPDVGYDDGDNNNNKGKDSPSGATNGMTSLLFVISNLRYLYTDLIEINKYNIS